MLVESVRLNCPAKAAAWLLQLICNHCWIDRLSLQRLQIERNSTDDLYGNEPNYDART